MAFQNAQSAAAALAQSAVTPAELREIVSAYPELRAAVAAHPNTDDGLLAWLGSLRDSAVDAALVKRAASGPSLAPPVAAAAPIPVVEDTVVSPTVSLAKPVAAPPSANAAPAIPAAYAPGPRKRTGLVIGIVVAALIVVGGGIGAAAALGMFSLAPAAPASSVAPVASASPAPVPVTSAPVSSAPVASNTPTSFVCWNGAHVAALAMCPAPTDNEEAFTYLRYIYPSLSTHANCVKYPSTNPDYVGFNVMWNCELGDALIRYRYWQNLNDANGHYNQKFSKSLLKAYDVKVGGVPIDGWAKTDKNTVKGPGGVKRVVISMLIPSEHVSLSVEANTTNAMWSALQLPRIRPAGQAMGYPSGQTPNEAPLTFTPR